MNDHEKVEMLKTECMRKIEGCKAFLFIGFTEIEAFEGEVLTVGAFTISNMKTLSLSMVRNKEKYSELTDAVLAARSTIEFMKNGGI